MSKALMTAAAAVLVASCTGGYATQSYEPVVDVYGSRGKDPATYEADLAACQQLSTQREQVSDTAKGALAGGALGAAGGAIGGAFSGSAGLGAAIGAAGGALTGAAASAYRANENRQNLVMNCMAGRGWSVVAR
jgi:hypothetical protein